MSTEAVSTAHEAAACIAPEGVDYDRSFVTMPTAVFEQIIHSRGYITRQEAADLWPCQPFDMNDGWSIAPYDPDVLVYAQAHDATVANLGIKKLAK